VELIDILICIIGGLYILGQILGVWRWIVEQEKEEKQKPVNYALIAEALYSTFGECFFQRPIKKEEIDKFLTALNN